MAHTNRNFVLAYIFLVGLPLLGLAGILKGGRHLTAPFSVDGAWKMVASQPLAPACKDFFSSVSSAPLSISQSGKSLVVTLNGGTRTTSGTLEGKIITAQFTVPDKSGAAQCGDGNLNLTATLDPLTDPRTISGTLSVEGCASCAPLEFRAARQPKPPGGTR
jgi:hypothetical protein